MKLFLSDAQLEHRPQQFMMLGKIAQPFENPSRLHALAGVLERLGLERAQPADRGLAPILSLHDAGYVEFLSTGYAAWAEIANAGPEMLPNTHPYRGRGSALGIDSTPPCTSVVGRAGWYVGDLACAMGPGTWGAVYASAQSAVSAAEAVLGGAPAAFALCRPPGHHAYADRASGFCFLNNAAIAAEMLAQRASKVAILDFDTHHGDGTQALFYERSDVLFASLHTDPSVYYPFFSGYAAETGRGDGLGATLNIPLPPGSGDASFLDACRALVDAVRRHRAEVLVVSAGWDAHRDDPLSRLDVSTDAFAHVGALLAGLGLPTVIVQEGGYSLEASVQAAAAFTRSFCASHALDGARMPPGHR